MENKVGEIKRIAQSFGLPEKNDISGYLEVEYQPKGQHQNENWPLFFGDNFARINEICGERMRLFNYDLNFTNE